jgi:hypothetical protein
MQEKKQENSLIKRNILIYADYKGISKYEIYQKTGISRSVLSQNNGMTEDNIIKFLAYYSEVNPEWLITGQGEMLKSNGTKTSDFISERPSKHPSRATFSGDKDNINQENTQEKNKKISSPNASTETYIIDTLMREMNAQKQELKEQAKEIGRLENEIKHLREQSAEKSTLPENVVEDLSCAVAG